VTGDNRKHVILVHEDGSREEYVHVPDKYHGVSWDRVGTRGWAGSQALVNAVAVFVGASDERR
jgi:hypothetical protein